MVFGNDLLRILVIVSNRRDAVGRTVTSGWVEAF